MAQRLELRRGIGGELQGEAADERHTGTGRGDWPSRVLVAVEAS
jgi:hypothetical protein